ncbi:hypothetical protein N782_16660 [Pontibacillus yanchengensis Y32]|uniref:Uncharacterized protein n=1 Tax=Pontibacillus yanchengensis Y32 TaxID=1385514 RepID=A0A0A2T7J7_9BACI|nr:hypothetical protein N782_16660 [Pontibacillus yanchengensis Y32]
MKTRTKVFITLVALSFLMVLFLYGTQSYFHYKEINLASDRCYEIGGTPIIEKDFLASNYSFSCEVSN